MASTAEERKRAILDRQLNGILGEKRPAANIFAYASLADKVILFVSSVSAILAGALNPLVPVIYGLLVGVFNGFATGSISAEELRSKMATFSLYYVYLSIGLFVLTYIATVGFYYSGERIARALRTAYLSAILRQNMAFFDLLSPGEITSRIMSDLGTVQEAVTSKVAVLLTALATFCAAFVVSFIMYWKTALIMSPFFATLILSISLLGGYSVRHHKQAMDLYGNAAGIAEEAIGAVRHVMAFGIQPLISKRYLSQLIQAGKADQKSENAVSGLIAWMNTMPCLLYALSFWAGSKFLVKGEVTGAEITTTTLAVTIGSFAIIRIAPSAQSLTSGVATTGVILKAISRRSPQDPLAEGGEKPAQIVGDIQLEDVDLVYPSRDNVDILRKVSLRCPAMKKTAIVGPSGSGKSSILGLVERFYEPTDGRVTLDGHDIQSLNLRWLRRHISLVDQNPVLFNASIMDNIQFGCSEVLDGTSSEDMQQRVIEAAKKANAHDFIMALPEAYETQVGDKGLQLSGGQRQRIAIARALIKDPKILLLDEATSALDSKSEAAVQAALEVASEDRTTIIVAHRLSTIRNADNIIVLADGRNVEQGTHQDLIDRNGAYAALVQKQQIGGSQAEGADALRESFEDEIHNEATSSVAASQVDEKKAYVETSAIRADSHTSSSEEESSAAPSAKQTLIFIGRMSSRDWKIVLFGFVSAIIAGLGIPAQSILFAKMLAVIGYPASRYAELKSDTDLYTGLFVALAGAAFVSWMGVGIALSYATQRLTRRVRRACFQSVMVQDMAFFDEPGNTPSALSSVLSKSTNDLAGMGGPVIGGVFTFVATIVGGVVLSLAIGWKLGLVCTATIPIVVACGWLRLQVLSTFDSKVRQSGLDSAAYAGELVRSVRTVASLGLEEYALTRYSNFLANQAAKSLRSILVASGLYAASHSVIYLCSALAFWYGGWLISKHEYSTFQVYICFVALISGAQIAGSIFTFAPDASKAMHASHELQKMMDMKANINKTAVTDFQQALSEKMGKQGTSPCRIDFSNVAFTYPSRPSRRALDGLNITVQPGQTLALVGQSGSGKTTCVSLLERFYEPDVGQVLVDGQDISQLNIDQYRQTISLVSQETIVLSGTIRENIAIGLTDQDVSDEDILNACRQANVLDFVQSLPDGLSTLVGSGGSMLSGGQKQRIALARAFLRKPKILLLDEATSALDTESEAIVQAAMDAIRKDRTTIMVAHRLSTVRNADIICVLQDGALLETGSHEQLMAKRGKYWEMVGMQNLH